MSAVQVRAQTAAPVATDHATSTPLALAGAARVFFAQRSPQIITLTFVASVVGRLVVGRWSWWDLLAPGIVIAVQPFTEWNIHVFLLHFKPRRLGSRTVDPLVSRQHRAHHADPKDLGLVFIPLPALLPLIGGIGAAFLLLLPLSRGLSALVGGYAVLFAYEWTHYLIHTTYRPRHRVYRYVWRAHRNHHFRNEHYWFGVTMHLADHVLGTFPEKTAVEVSPTARTLGVRTV
jgi:sterol desaturase/sphingolipid hydroxylase (fatty acid hydroxylase superfamily)